MNVDHEVALLVDELNRFGGKVKFGTLCTDERCADMFEALGGTLKAAKKRKVISYDSELLLQGAHDDVEIVLLQPNAGLSNDSPQKQQDPQPPAQQQQPQKPETQSASAEEPPSEKPPAEQPDAIPSDSKADEGAVQESAKETKEADADADDDAAAAPVAAQ